MNGKRVTVCRPVHMAFTSSRPFAGTAHFPFRRGYFNLSPEGNRPPRGFIRHSTDYRSVTGICTIKSKSIVVFLLIL